MDKVQLLQNAINFAKKNPDSPESVELRRRIESGMYVRELGIIKNGVPKKDSLMEKVADFTGGKEIGQGLGQAIANSDFQSPGSQFKNPITGKVSEPISKGNATLLEETQKSQGELADKFIQTIKEKKERGEDTTKLEESLKELGMDIAETGAGAEKMLNPNELTNKQVVGDTLQLATTVLGAGQLPGVAKSATAATTVGKGIVQGAKSGAIAGGIYGTSTGVSQGLQKDKTAGGIAIEGALGGVTGLVTGGILGGIIGGISGGVRGHALRKEVLNAQINSGEKTVPQLTAAKQKANEIARQQGIPDTDIEFINSMSSQDKVKAQRMIDLAEKATVNKRAIERPIDVVGESMVERIKFLQKTNATSGKAVDATARALKGNKVDATSLRTQALSLLEDAGVTANKNGTPNWSKSIFSKNPELQKKIMNALSDLPAGEIDAYDLHIFKKSIDEVVDYGVAGEGLKGKSASILKAIRNGADEILDGSFDSYNKANTDFKVTREVLDAARDLFGKKGGFAKERGGQLLRSVFSNNANRPRVLALIEQLDKTSNTYGGNFKDNLVDQALFTEILEDIYGTQATTALQGQVQRALHGALKVAEGVKDPIKGAGHLLSAGIEKFAGISPEVKKQILSALIK